MSGWIHELLGLQHGFAHSVSGTLLPKRHSTLACTEACSDILEGLDYILLKMSPHTSLSCAYVTSDTSP